MSANSNQKGYLIALVQERASNTIKIYGSPADRNDCDEILEINGKSFNNNKANELGAAAAVEAAAAVATSKANKINESEREIERRTEDKKSADSQQREDGLAEDDDHDDDDEHKDNNTTYFGDRCAPINAQQHAEIVKHIHECIKLRNICLKVKRAPIKLNPNGIETSLLDVFVIGSNAHEQLNRFFKITNLLANPKDLLKLTNKMELAEFNSAAANQAVANGNGTTFNINQQQLLSNQQSQAQQLHSNNQMGIGTTTAQHMYRNHQQQQQHQHQQQQQQQQQQQALRYMNSPKVPKHRELPVDVPDSFIGVKKQAPRYPPPKPHRQVSPSMPLNYYTSFSNTPSTMPYNNTNSTNPTTAQQQQTNITTPISQNTAANIMTHNSSLRSSIKLKQLEKSRNGNYPVGQMQPAINQAFELNEDDAVTATINSNGTANNNQATNHPNAANNNKQALKIKQSMSDVCSIYDRLQRNLNEDFADVSGDAKLSKLLSIYNTIVQTHNKQFRIPTLASRHNMSVNAQGQQEPVIYKVSDLLHSVISLLNTDDGLTMDAAELLSILCKHEVDGVCSAFDRIAQSFEFAKSSRSTSPQESVEMVSEEGAVVMPFNQSAMYQHNQVGMHQVSPHQMNVHNNYVADQVTMDIENNLYQNSLHPLTDIDLSDGSCTKIVSIEKTSNQALGATIKNDVDGSVVIGRIVCGGAAYKSGLLHEGDEILEVNNVQMRGKNVNEVVNILEGMNGTLTFKVVARNYNKPVQRNEEQKIFVRAFFKFDGENDDFIPCKELGLSFDRGDVLTIIDQTDSRWWQAYREGDSEWRLAGLIPSINFLKQREKDTNHEDISEDYFKQEKKTLVSMLFNCPKGTSPRRRKKPPNIPFGLEEVPYYEQVCIYYPDKYRKRPIVFAGPKSIGQKEISKRLVLDRPDRFASAIAHTSKPVEPGKENDFHYVSRAQFEADTKAGKFVEYGMFQNQYYGTTLDAMKEVVKSKKTCLLLVSTPSIYNLRHSRAGSELQPIFVFFKPDDSHPEKLRNIVSSFMKNAKSNQLEESIKSIMAEVELIETHYLTYFDLVITVSNVESAYQELLFKIERLENDPQWIPSFWKDQPPS